jgi:hypothetical protein
LEVTQNRLGLSHQSGPLGMRGYVDIQIVVGKELLIAMCSGRERMLHDLFCVGSTGSFPCWC